MHFTNKSFGVVLQKLYHYFFETTETKNSYYVAYISFSCTIQSCFSKPLGSKSWKQKGFEIMFTY